MKNRFFNKAAKTLLLAGCALALCNCSEENFTPPVSSSVYVVNEPSFLYDDGNMKLLVSVNGTVKDTAGNVVGAADITSGLIIANDQTVIAQGVDFNQFEPIMPTKVTAPAWVIKAADKVYVIYTDAKVTDADGNAVGAFIAIDPQAPSIGNIIDFNGTPILENVDLTTLKTVAANVTTPNNGNSVTAKSSSSTSENGGATPSVKSSNSNGGITPTSSSITNQNPVQNSSASKPKSSSSTLKSSSSTGGSGNGSSYTIKYVNGGKSGSGYATRYWDCCKPHCAWAEHGGTANACDASGNKISDKSAQSMCDGGNAGICRGQFPIVVNDTLAFAFAATPGGENNCGKCFDLAFTGKGKYATDNHGKLKGKHLIVMSSNVGYDVAGGQFDVMIPGGGYGIFNGCSQRMGWGSQGAQYGGLLTECEESSGYKASTYKSCLTKKCNESFANDPQAKEGCLFLANWMNAAGNPLHNYREVECPKELLERY